MLGLPSSTEIKIRVSKERIYRDFDISPAARRQFDDEISRIDIVNEVSSATTVIPEGKTAPGFYVLRIVLKDGSIDRHNIELLSKCFPQRIVYVLEDVGKGRLAVYRGKVHFGQERPIDELRLRLDGLDFDEVWDNVIIQIGDIHVEDGKTLDEQIAEDETVRKLTAKIDSLDKRIRIEKQPKRQQELLSQMKELKRELETVRNGGHNNA